MFFFLVLPLLIFHALPALITAFSPNTRGGLTAVYVSILIVLLPHLSDLAAPRMLIMVLLGIAIPCSLKFLAVKLKEKNIDAVKCRGIALLALLGPILVLSLEDELRNIPMNWNFLIPDNILFLTDYIF